MTAPARNFDGTFKRGLSYSPETQFKKGQHWRRKKLYWEKDWLYNEYINNLRSASEIASQFGVGGTAILYWLTKHGIQTRSVKDVRAIKHWGLSGEANPMYGKRGKEVPSWKGGTTPDRQKDYSKPEVLAFLTSIRVRDKFCRRCGVQSKLHVHHIKSFTEFPELRYDPDNCVSLCQECHLWVHSGKNTERQFLWP